MSFRAVDDHVRIDLSGGGALFTTRRGGVSEGPFAALNLGSATDDDPARVAENRERVRALVGARVLAVGHQVHGSRVVVDADSLEDADGQVVTTPGVAAMVLTADCLPIALVADGAVAMLHAGWRGLAEGVLEAGVVAIGRPAVAAIGPGIGPCCYAVGDDVRQAFGTVEPTLDLKAIARERLQAAGVLAVHDCGLCTACDRERFFSHRRERGVTGRQAGLAWLS